MAAPRAPQVARKRTIMTLTAYRPLALAGLILFALPACASSTTAMTASDSTAPAAVDLGPSSRIPVTRMAMAGAGHELQRSGTSDAPAGKPQLIHEGGNDAHATGTVNSVDP